MAMTGGPGVSRSAWPDERTVWRWHFFAGLLCLPFVAFLSLTGTVYLFKPQVDDLIDRQYEHLAVTGAPALASREVAAALGAEPGARLLAYELPRTPHSAARVVVKRGHDAIRVYVDPYSLGVLKRVSEERRFERIVFGLHGQLLLGNAGSMIMEMVASWTIVLVATGLYLWWPRPAGRFRAGGVLYPRLSGGGRTAWRDLHAVTGLFVSLVLVSFLATGLPWSFLWGHALQTVEHRVGRIMAIQDWEIGHVPARVVMAGAPDARPAPGAARDAMPGMDMPPADAPADRLDAPALDRVVAAGAALDLPYPVLVTPPRTAGGAWRVRSDTQDRPRRAAVTVAPDGRIVGRERFADKPVVDRVVAYGVAAHEGQLFGAANQAVNLLVALALLVMSSAACVLWLRRRPRWARGLGGVGLHAGAGPAAAGTGRGAAAAGAGRPPGAGIARGGLTGPARASAGRNGAHVGKSSSGWER
jgi:uncharacterized iron-regulated membrane protein